MFRSRSLLLALLLLPLVPAPSALAHGSHGGGGEESLEAGEFDFTPLITVEGHGGFDTNLEGSPKHYAVDALFGGVFQWGLGNGGSLSIEAAVGPTLVWGEAEHFYGKVHAHDDHDEHEEDHDEHEHDEHEEGHDEHEEDHDEHEEDHDEHEEDHDDEHEHEHEHDDEHEHEHDDHDHEGHAHEGHDHGHGSTEFQRTDVRGYLQVRYAPNDRLSFSVNWNPYFVTQDQGHDVQGLKNEIGAKVLWALGDGDVNFGLGDGLEDLVNGVFLSVEHRQGWESDGVWIGNYTDPRVGVGFTIGSDQINVSIEAGPRFYTPGSYSGLDQRTDFAGEIELLVPVGDANLFAHWQPTYSGTDAPGWGEGWQHHIGTGMSFTF
jgi:hypothetical protein